MTLDLKQIREKYETYLIERRRDFHRHPELSRREKRTSRIIREELDRFGIPNRVCGDEIAPYGVVGEIRGAKPGKTIILRGDFDALPIYEKSDVPFRSEKDGVMHACGHDAHTAMLLTCAQILMERRDQLAGTVRLVFQSGEEDATGAQAMIREGAADGADAAFAIHVWADVPAGRIACEEGPVMAGGNHFTVKVHGKSAHGALPHQGIDAITAAAAMIMDLQTLISRELSPLHPEVLTIGRIDGGKTWNVIPESVEFEGTARLLDPDDWEHFPEHMERVIHGVAETYRVKAELDYIKNINLMNDGAMARLVRAASEKVMGEGTPYHMGPTMSGEDFSYFLRKMPGAICFLGIRNAECGAVYGQHSDYYKIDESVLIGGAALYAQVALDYLSE